MKTTVLITGLLLIVLANFIALYYAPYGREYFQNMPNKPFANTTGPPGPFPPPPPGGMRPPFPPPGPYPPPPPPGPYPPPPPPGPYPPPPSRGSSGSSLLSALTSLVAPKVPVQMQPIPMMLPNKITEPTKSNPIMPIMTIPSKIMTMPTARNKIEGFSSMSLDSAAGANTLYTPMGQFDGVKLSTGNSVSGWRYTAPNEPLTGAEFVPGQDALFMFKNNQCKPECCGASFSCGGGCVCTTPQQRQYIAARGGNRTEPEDSA